MFMSDPLNNRAVLNAHIETMLRLATELGVDLIIASHIPAGDTRIIGVKHTEPRAPHGKYLLAELGGITAGAMAKHSAIGALSVKASVASVEAGHEFGWTHAETLTDDKLHATDAVAKALVDTMEAP